MPLTTTTCAQARIYAGGKSEEMAGRILPVRPPPEALLQLLLQQCSPHLVGEQVGLVGQDVALGRMVLVVPRVLERSAWRPHHPEIHHPEMHHSETLEWSA